MIREINKYIILIFIFSISSYAQWTEIQNPFGSSISKIHFFDENNGWMSNYFNLVKTENGGEERFHFFDIIYPNSGDTLKALTEVQLKWNIPNVAWINIKFSSDDGITWETIATKHDQSKFFWTIPNIQSNKCRLLIENWDNPEFNEETGTFTIVPPPPLILKSPDRHTYELKSGDFYDISWLAFNENDIKLEFSADSGLTWNSIIDSYPADSLKYIWKVPFVQSYNCLIKISDVTNPSIYSISNGKFSIRFHYLNIVYPDYETIFHSGDTQFLKIEGEYRGAMKLEFTSDNGRNWTFIDSLNSSEWGKEFSTYTSWSHLYQWLVPNINSNSCRFKLADYEADNFIANAFTFSIKNTISVKTLIDKAQPGDTIYLEEPEYWECIKINKPITIVGKGINKTIITGDTLKPVIIIQSNNVVIKNLTIAAKTKTNGNWLHRGDYIPTNGMEIINSKNVILDSLYISGGKDLSTTGFISGGIGIEIKNSKNINLSNLNVIGADAQNYDTEGGSEENGGDGLRIIECDTLNISNCKIKGGEGGNGYAMGASPCMGGYGGNSLNLLRSSEIKITNSHLVGGIGGRTAYSSVYYTLQAKAGDGTYCDSTKAIYTNTVLEGGAALINSPPSKPLNTLGGNGITAVNYSSVIIDGGKLIRGTSSEDAMGKLFYSDSTSEITFSNIKINTTIKNFECQNEKNKIKLSWNAIIGLNFMEFKVERNIDNSEWNSIGIIKDTPQDSVFMFIDSNYSSTSKNLKYRIDVINLDSTFNISEEKEISFIPSVYKLEQNYPNPFNPSTTIEYSIPKQSDVTLKVYDILGREVTTLVNEEKPEGYYKVNFDGSDLSSGVYFYRLKAGHFVETKKLILIK